MWRCVLFDLGDTLTDNHPCPPAQMDRLIARGFVVWLRRRSMRAGDEFTPDDRARLAEIGASRLVDAVNRALEDVRDKYWRDGLEAPPGTVFNRLQAEIAAASGLVASLSELEEVYLKERLSRQRLLPGAHELLLLLRNAGVKLGLVSNSVFSREPMYAHLRQLGIAELLSAVVYSSDIGYRKPNPKPFMTAMAQLGCAPNEAVFVGDAPEADLAGAVGAGLAAVWVWGRNEAAQALAQGPALGPGTWPDMARVPELRLAIEKLIRPPGRKSRPGLVGAARQLHELGPLLVDR